jgi:hypothetical protein
MHSYRNNVAVWPTVGKTCWKSTKLHMRTEMHRDFNIHYSKCSKWCPPCCSHILIRHHKLERTPRIVDGVVAVHMTRILSWRAAMHSGRMLYTSDFKIPHRKESSVCWRYRSQTSHQPLRFHQYSPAISSSVFHLHYVLLPCSSVQFYWAIARNSKHALSLVCFMVICFKYATNS